MLVFFAFYSQHLVHFVQRLEEYILSTEAVIELCA